MSLHVRDLNVEDNLIIKKDGRLIGIPNIKQRIRATVVISLKKKKVRYIS